MDHCTIERECILMSLVQDITKFIIFTMIAIAIVVAISLVPSSSSLKCCTYSNSNYLNDRMANMMSVYY